MQAKNKSALLATAVAAMLAGAPLAGCKSNASSSDSGAAAMEKHACAAGKNACKGLGGCKTGDNGCKGLNSCKGKGGCGETEKHSCS